VPQIPHTPCTGTAPIGSSILRASSTSIATITMTPAMPPSTIAPNGDTQ
jgi:hypothetical protein